MTRRALVVDARSLLIRGFNTFSAGRTSASGEPTNALFAVARSVVRALDFKQPDIGVAVVPQDWGPMEAALAPQAEGLADMLAAHGLTIVRSPKPTDLVASYVRASLLDGCDAVVVGSDKRLAQLVADDVWWYDAYKDVRYTPELVRKRFDVGPEHVSEWLALVGDDDTLGGVKGIGKKGATTLIEEHGSVRNALESVEDIGGRTGKALQAAGDAVAIELDRAHLEHGLELPVSLEAALFRAPESQALQTLYGELGFFELLSSGDSRARVEVCASAASLEAAIEAFDDTAVALWALTEDPSPVRGELAGLAMAQADRVIYVPLLGKGETLDDASHLAGFLSDPARPKIGHDIKAAMVALARHEIEVAGVVADTACASHLGEPSNRAPHDLQVVARSVLRRALPEEEEARGVGRRQKRWSQIAVEEAAAYAGTLAAACAEVWDALRSETDEALLAEYLEMSAMLVQIELFGIGCDGEDLEKAGADFARIAGELEAEIFALAGKELNLGSTKQLGSVLFEDLGLPVVKKTKTGWSTANEALERIEHAHPIVSLVIRWRRLRRLMDSWVTALLKTIDADGRVRSTFSPARSFSGRLVNASPDLGRVPGRTPEMVRIRHAFCAAPGSVLLSVDYRQLGLFVLAHLSKDPALVEPLRLEHDLHTLTAAAVLDLDPEEVDRDRRQLGKIVNFATFAGQGASALSLQLGMSAAEAKELIARFNQRYSVVREFQEEQLRLAKERGYIVTIAGRRWPIGGLQSPDHMERAYAERLARRATHEGSVADVSRRGLLRAYQALRAAGFAAMPVLQVHDEVLFEVPADELTDVARAASDAMRGAFDLEVPLRVGCKAGPNWAELEPLPQTGE